MTDGPARPSRPARPARPTPARLPPARLAATEPLRVLVIDPTPLLRRGVVSVVAAEPDMRMVGDTGSVRVAVQLARVDRPDVVLIGLGVAGGVAEACDQLRAQIPEVRVVVLAAVDDEAEIAHAVRAGARGYLLRDAEPGELVDALRTVAAGQSLLAPAVAERLIDEFAALTRRVESGEGSSSLSVREVEVLRLVAAGLNNRAIAERLFISENTVKNHVRSIHEKLQVHSRMEAVVRGVRDGLVVVG